MARLQNTSLRRLWLSPAIWAVLVLAAASPLHAACGGSELAASDVAPAAAADADGGDKHDADAAVDTAFDVDMTEGVLLDAVIDVDSEDAGEELPEVLGPVEPEDLFALGPPVSVDLLLSADALASLEVAPQEWVSGTLTFAGWPQADAPPLEVQVRLGGEFGGARDLTEKAAFELIFPNPVAGLSRLSLNNNVRNRAQARAQVTYALARSWGVPAPQASWAWVTVNGAVYGLYGMEESYQGPRFLQRWWSGADLDGLEVYRVGSDFGDVTSGLLTGVTKLTGDPEDRAALEALSTALAAMDADVEDDALMAALGAHFDMQAYVDFAALEIVVAHTQGAAMGRRNHVLVHDTESGLWHYAVAGGERAFRLINSPWLGSGRVQRLCLRSPQCRLALGERLAALVEHAASNGIIGVAQSACALVETVIADDPRVEASPAQVSSSCQQMIERLASWTEALPYNLACANPAAVDHDGDGYSGCTDDCNDEDPSINPGAPELCNLVDDDCSGAIDDVDTCDKCVSFTSTFGVDYDLCFEPKSWNDGREFCIARGGEMASIHSEAVQLELQDAAFDVLVTNWWVGLTDSDEEGTWTWSDGTPLNYERWNNGEPNDSNGEDCGHLSVWGGGNWNDAQCTNTYAVICQIPDKEL